MKVKRKAVEVTAGGVGGATLGGALGSKIGIAAMGTAIAGTVPLAILGGILGICGAILISLIGNRHRKNHR